MNTRRDYMEHRITHREYYGQMVNDSVLQLVDSTIGRDRIARSKDENLNDIPLHRWDQLFPSIQRCVPALPEGEVWSLSVGVCIAKEAARQLVESADA